MSLSTNWLQPVYGQNSSSIQTVCNCLTSYCSDSDNYTCLILADISFEDHPSAKLKKFRGTYEIEERELQGVPTGIQTIYINDVDEPVMAVSISNSILFYRNLRPYYKFTYSKKKGNDMEKDQQLREINYDKSKVKTINNIVSICLLPRVNVDINRTSYLVAVVDNGDVFIVDPKNFCVIYEAETCQSHRTTPCILATNGSFDTDFCIAIGTRENSIHILRKSILIGQIIFNTTRPIIGMTFLPIDQTILLCSMEKRLTCCSKKGKEIFNISLPLMPTCMISITLPFLGITLICVSLDGGRVQFYQQKILIEEFQMACSVSALLFGNVGLEENVLTLITIDGKLTLKIMRRVTDFTTNYNMILKGNNMNRMTLLPELVYPKKNSVFMEQELREKNHTKELRTAFQNEMLRLRNTVARATVQEIYSPENFVSDDQSHALMKLSAEVHGIWPAIQLYITLQNLSSNKLASNLSIVFHVNRKYVSPSNPKVLLPGIIPGISLRIVFNMEFAFDMELTESSPNDTHVSILLIKSHLSKPLIATSLKINPEN